MQDISSMLREVNSHVYLLHSLGSWNWNWLTFNLIIWNNSQSMSLGQTEEWTVSSIRNADGFLKSILQLYNQLYHVEGCVPTERQGNLGFPDHKEEKWLSWSKFSETTFLIGRSCCQHNLTQKGMKITFSLRRIKQNALTMGVSVLFFILESCMIQQSKKRENCAGFQCLCSTYFMNYVDMKPLIYSNISWIHAVFISDVDFQKTQAPSQKLKETCLSLYSWV